VCPRIRHEVQVSRRIARIARERMEGERRRGFDEILGRGRLRRILRLVGVGVCRFLIVHRLLHQKSHGVDQEKEGQDQCSVIRRMSIFVDGHLSQGISRIVRGPQADHLGVVDIHHRLVDGHLPDAIHRLHENARLLDQQDHDGTNVPPLHPEKEVQVPTANEWKIFVINSFCTLAKRQCNVSYISIIALNLSHTFLPFFSFP